ncbi:MAG TPA: hypothetical protein VFZ69_16610 [Longimicrobiales bacterium]
MSRSLSLALAFTAISAVSLAAQSAPVRAGDEVRVQSRAAAGRFTVTAVTSGILTLCDSAANCVGVPVGDVTELEVFRGPRSGWAGAGRGAGYGFLAGAGAGILIGLASGDDDPRSWFALSAEEKAFMGGVLLGGAGGIIGALIGVSAPGERWERVDLRRDATVSASRDGGVAVGYTLRF